MRDNSEFPLRPLFLACKRWGFSPPPVPGALFLVALVANCLLMESCPPSGLSGDLLCVCFTSLDLVLFSHLQQQPWNSNGEVQNVTTAFVEQKQLHIVLRFWLSSVLVCVCVCVERVFFFFFFFFFFFSSLPFSSENACM